MFSHHTLHVSRHRASRTVSHLFANQGSSTTTQLSMKAFERGRQLWV